YIDELFYIKFKELRDRIISVFCDLNIPNSLIVIKELYYNKYNQNIIYIAMRQIMELSISTPEEDQVRNQIVTYLNEVANWIDNSIICLIAM
ncbi:hypothetical protein ACUOCP_48620, partial [Escherichia sp. R-CC3]